MQDLVSVASGARRGRYGDEWGTGPDVVLIARHAPDIQVSVSSVKVVMSHPLVFVFGSSSSAAARIARHAKVLFVLLLNILLAFSLRTTCQFLSSFYEKQYCLRKMNDVTKWPWTEHWPLYGYRLLYFLIKLSKRRAVVYTSAFFSPQGFATLSKL